MAARADIQPGLSSLLEVVLGVAEDHGSNVAVADLLQLLPEGVTAIELTDALSDPRFSGRYLISEGVVLNRDHAADQLEDFRRRQDFSASNITAARLLL